MKKIIQWKNANKLAIIFSIIGGVYLIYLLINLITSEKYMFDSAITINKFNHPNINDKYSFRKQARDIIPSNFNSFDLSRNITDTLYKTLGLSELNWFTINENIEKAIPKELDRTFLVDKIDSLILDETYPLRETSCYIESLLKNKGDKIVKELRFELPSKGYFELYINENFVSSGNYQNHIFIDELRPENSALLRIWSFEHLSEYYLVYTNQIKYTFDNGHIVPTMFVPIRLKGFFYWIYKKPFWASYLLLWLPIVFTYLLARNWRSNNRESEQNEE